jgi:ATP-dependent DNA helicase UvrD/PcrA
MAWDDNLDRQSPAYGIASAAERFVRVVAGPGTGKSFALNGALLVCLKKEPTPSVSCR